jgi:hypothetical protein
MSDPIHTEPVSSFEIMLKPTKEPPKTMTDVAKLKRGNPLTKLSVDMVVKLLCSCCFE